MAENCKRCGCRLHKKKDLYCASCQKFVLDELRLKARLNEEGLKPFVRSENRDRKNPRNWVVPSNEDSYGEDSKP